MSTAIVFWICAVIAFAVIEAVTTTLVSVWFCGGAVAALIATALGATPLVREIVFVAVSAVLLACLRPLAKRLTANRQKEATNADRILGARAVVTEAIDPIAGTGAVRVGGLEWTAKADCAIAEGSVVTVRRIEGVKVCVEPEPVNFEKKARM